MSESKIPKEKITGQIILTISKDAVESSIEVSGNVALEMIGFLEKVKNDLIKEYTIMRKK